MTAVPKPLKFLRPHYDELTELYEKWAAGDDKVGTAIYYLAIMLIFFFSGLSRRHAFGFGNDIRCGG